MSSLLARLAECSQSFSENAVVAAPSKKTVTTQEAAPPVADAVVAVPLPGPSPPRVLVGDPRVLLPCDKAYTYRRHAGGKELSRWYLFTSLAVQPIHDTQDLCDFLRALHPDTLAKDPLAGLCNFLDEVSSTRSRVFCTCACLILVCLFDLMSGG